MFFPVPVTFNHLFIQKLAQMPVNGTFVEMQPLCKSGIANARARPGWQRGSAVAKNTDISVYLFFSRTRSAVFKMVYLVAIVFPDNFSFPEEEKKMVFDGSPVDVCIEGNICDGPGRMTANVAVDQRARFLLFSSSLDPAKSRRMGI